MFFSPLTWFTYTMIPPIWAFFGWLALPFTFFSSILAIVFGIIQLWKETPLLHPTSFVSTHEALKTIFPQATNEEITKYEKQLSRVKNLDPVLIISPNQAWINQQALIPNAQPHPIGTAWILTKVGMRNSDFGEDI
ncbi:16721_t:CDS:2, partial [Acaulospora morrowiae]